MTSTFAFRKNVDVLSRVTWAYREVFGFGWQGWTKCHTGARTRTFLRLECDTTSTVAVEENVHVLSHVSWVYPEVFVWLAGGWSKCHNGIRTSNRFYGPNVRIRHLFAVEENVDILSHVSCVWAKVFDWMEGGGNIVTGWAGLVLIGHEVQSQNIPAMGSLRYSGQSVTLWQTVHFMMQQMYILGLYEQSVHCRSECHSSTLSQGRSITVVNCQTEIVSHHLIDIGLKCCRTELSLKTVQWVEV